VILVSRMLNKMSRMFSELNDLYLDSLLITHKVKTEKAIEKVPELK
jgi:hypothetical protein